MNYEIISPEQSATILHNADITSTDELVMVLTEQDYNNEQNDALDADHSNIVVLYSHPVDCPDTQFLSSSNIVLTSQANIIELSTNSIVSSASNFITTSSQISLPTKIESIELIQNEINDDSNENSLNKDNQESVIQEKQILIETMDVEILCDKEIKENEKVNTLIKQDHASSSKNDCSVPNDLKECIDNVQSNFDEKPNENATTVDTNTSAPRSAEQIKLNLSSDTSAIPSSSVSANTEDVQVENNEVEPNISTSTENIQDVEKQNISLGEPLSEIAQSSVEEKKETLEDTHEIKSNKEVEFKVTSISDSKKSKDKAVLSKMQQKMSKNVTLSDNSLHSQSEKKQDLGESEPIIQSEHTPESLNIILKPILVNLESSIDILPSQPNNKATEDHMLVSFSENTGDQIETSNLSEVCLEIHPSSETVEEEELISHRSLKSNKKKPQFKNKRRKVVRKLRNSVNRRAARSILADWDDADSQQSGFKNGANVDKLIDDWDDDEEEGKK